METELITESLYEIKSLFSLYSGYARSSPKNPLESKSAQKEMKLVKQQILKQLIELKKLVRKMETERAPQV